MLKISFLARRAMFLLTKVCDGSAKRHRFEVDIFIWGACSQGKIVTLNLIRTVSPTHTEVRVFDVFVNKRNLYF